MAINFHLIGSQCLRAIRIVIKKRFWLRDLYAIERAEMPNRRCERSMRCLVLTHQHERFFFGAPVQPGNRLVRRQVSRVAFEFLFGAVHLDEFRIVIITLII